MMLVFQAFLVLCLSGYSVYSQGFRQGECPDLETVPDFDMTKYLGMWYLVEHYCEACNKLEQCSSMNFTRDDNSTVRFLLHQIHSKSGVLKLTPGILEPSNSDAGKLYWAYRSGRKADYWVLDTDYESYSVTYGCGRGRHLNSYLWVQIFTRDPNPSETVVAKYFEVAERYNFTRVNFQRVKQDDCTF